MHVQLFFTKPGFQRWLSSSLPCVWRKALEGMKVRGLQASVMFVGCGVWQARVSSAYDRLVQQRQETHCLYQLKYGHEGGVCVLGPTLAFNHEKLEYSAATLLVDDVGGNQATGRPPISQHFTSTAQAIVLVVDAADVSQLGPQVSAVSESEPWDASVARMIKHVLAEQDLELAPLLILANKQDLPGALSADALSERLALAEAMAGEKRWHVIGCSAETSTGLQEGIDWLLHTLGGR